MYAILNADGTIKQICIGYEPTGAVAITEAIADSPNDYIYQNGQFVYQPNLTPFKNAKIAELDQACSQAISQGFTSSALGVAHTYPYDDEAQRNLHAAIIDTLIDSTVTTVSFKTLDAGYQNHTVAQIQQVAKDSKTPFMNNLNKYNNLKSQVQSATTVDAINAIVWT